MEQAKTSMAIYLICTYFIGSAAYSLFSIMSAATITFNGLLFAAVGFQSLKVCAGLALYFRQSFTRYIALAILVWSLIATGLGFINRPLSSQTTYTLIYVAVTLSMLLAFTAYTFWLGKRGYYAQSFHA